MEYRAEHVESNNLLRQKTHVSILTRMGGKTVTFAPCAELLFRYRVSFYYTPLRTYVELGFSLSETVAFSIFGVPENVLQ